MTSQNNIPACKDNYDTILVEQDNALVRDLRELNPVAIKSRLSQAPNTDNNHTAIVTGEVKTAKGVYTGIGAATPDSFNGTSAPQQLIDEATAKAIYRAASMAMLFGDTCTDVSCLTVTPAKNTAITSETTFNAGNSRHKTQSGTITRKQINFLKQLAEYNDTSVEHYAKTYCNKTTNQLSSSEANMIIQRVKNE